MGLQYKWFIIHPKIARELDEILSETLPLNKKDEMKKNRHRN